MPDGGGDSQKEMLAKEQKATRTGIPRLDELIRIATDKGEGKARNGWARNILTDMDFHPAPNFLVASALANMAKGHGVNENQDVRDTVRAISERE